MINVIPDSQARLSTNRYFYHGLYTIVEIYFLLSKILSKYFVGNMISYTKFKKQASYFDIRQTLLDCLHA